MSYLTPSPTELLAVVLSFQFCRIFPFCFYFHSSTNKTLGLQLFLKVCPTSFPSFLFFSRVMCSHHNGSWCELILQLYLLLLFQACIHGDWSQGFLRVLCCSTHKLPLRAIISCNMRVLYTSAWLLLCLKEPFFVPFRERPTVCTCASDPVLNICKHSMLLNVQLLHWLIPAGFDPANIVGREGAVKWEQTIYEEDPVIPQAPCQRGLTPGHKQIANMSVFLCFIQT